MRGKQQPTCWSLVVVAWLAALLAPSEGTSTVLNASIFKQFSGPPGAFDVVSRGHSHTDGYVYIVFSSMGGAFDDTGYEYDAGGAACYLRKVDSSMNTVWTRSFRSTSDASNLQSGQGCLPQFIRPDADPEYIEVYYFKWDQPTQYKAGFKRFNVTDGSSTAEVTTVIVDEMLTTDRPQAWYNLPSNSNSRFKRPFYTTYMGPTFAVDSGANYFGAETGSLKKLPAGATSEGAATWNFQNANLGSNTITNVILDPTESFVYILATTSFMVVATDGTYVAHYPVSNIEPSISYGINPVALIADDVATGVHTIYIANYRSATLPGSVSCPSSYGGSDFYLLKATINSTDLHSLEAVWCAHAGTSLTDSPGPHDQSISAHPQHGIFVIGQTTGSLPSYSNQGGYDIMIVRFGVDGSVIDSWQGGSAGNDYGGTVFFDPTTGNAPFVTGMVTGDIDGAGPEVFVEGHDFIYGFFNYSSGCDKGYYRTGIPTCTPCSPGFFTTQIDRLVCTECPAGSKTLAPLAATSCTLCEAGTVAKTPATVTCQPCDIGYYYDKEGGTACLPCNVGTYASIEGTATCSRCPVSSYNDKVASGNCTVCPLGASTEGDGTAEERYCTCSKDYYGNPTGALEGEIEECKACVAGITECSRNQRYPHPIRGYFVDKADASNVFKCTPSSACPGGGVNVCDTGYTGTACSECSTGYYRDSGICSECPSLGLGTILPIVVFILGLITVVGAICCLFTLLALMEVSTTTKKMKKTLIRWIRVIRETIRRFQRTTAKYSVKFIQIMNVVLVLDVSWPGTILSVKSFFTTLGQYLAMSSLINTDCIPSLSGGADMRAGFQFSVLGILLGIIVIYLVVGFVMSVTCRRCAKKMRMHLGASVMLQVLNTLYLTLHTLIVSIFSCFEMSPGDYRMTKDPSIVCYVTTGTWGFLMYVGIFGVIAVSLGVPITIAILLWARALPSAKNNLFLQSTTQFLVEPYKPNMHYYELVSISERMFIPLAALWAPVSPLYQAVYLQLTVGVYLLIYWRRNAFILKAEYIWAISVSMCSILIVLVSGLAATYSSDNASDQESADNLMTVLVYGCVGWIAILALLSSISAVTGPLHKELFSQKTRLGIGLKGGSSDDEDSIAKDKELVNDPTQELNPFDESGKEGDGKTDMDRKVVAQHLPAAMANVMEKPRSPASIAVTKAELTPPRVVATTPALSHTPTKVAPPQVSGARALAPALSRPGAAGGGANPGLRRPPPLLAKR